MSMIRRREIAAYALPALPLALLTLPLYVLVPAFYARELMLPIAAVGSALLAVRIIDAFADPITGLFADRWRPTFGRRRIWLLLASLPTALSAYLVFTPPKDAGLFYLTFWGILLSVASTAILVPYAAWGAELTPDYKGRARVTAWRETFALIGTLLALFAQVLVPLAGFDGDGAVLHALGLFTLVLLPLAALLCVARVPEPKDHSQRPLPLREGLVQILANKPFLRLIFAFLLNGFANGFPATLFLFYVSEKLGAGDSAGPLLVLYFLCGLAGVPFWLWLARKTSKHQAWCLGMLLACACFLPAPFLSNGATALFAAVCIGTGLALGADLVLPPAIQADVIDVDTAATGEQRSGLYFAAWGLATKLALALAVGLAFPLLGWAGFDPAAGLRTEQGLAMLGFLYAGLPIILKIGAAALMLRFPIDEAEQVKLRAKIEAR